MKIGMCTNMNPTRPDKTGLESLDLIVSAGFDYVEAPAAQLLDLRGGAFDDAVAAFTGCGVPTLSLNNLFQPRVRVTGPDVDAGQIDAYTDRVIDLVKKLGVETLVFGSSGARNVPMNFPREQAMRQIIDMLSRFGPKAEKAGVTIVIEHINHLESNIVDWFAEAMWLLDEVNHPAVCGFVDYYHLGLGNEPLSLVEENFNRIRHAHFANLLERTIPTPDLHEASGVAFLQLLKKKGYQHKISVEGYGKDLAKEYAGALRFMRDHLQ